MVFKESVLKAADNSGARLLRCIQVVGRSVAREGDFIIVSAIRVRPGKKVQKGKVYKAVVVQCRKTDLRSFGHSVEFRSNRAVLIRKSEGRRSEPLPVGSRINKVLSFRLRTRLLTKLILISAGQL